MAARSPASSIGYPTGRCRLTKVGSGPTHVEESLPMHRLALDRDWRLREYDHDDPGSNALKHEGWLIASVPGTVHEALIAAGRIPEPFYGLNERDVQWVGERDWLYRC